MAFDFNLFPNPATHTAQVAVPNLGVDFVVEVRDLVGRLILSESHAAQTAQIQLDVTPLASGSYNVIVLAGNLKASKRLIK